MVPEGMPWLSYIMHFLVARLTSSGQAKAHIAIVKSSKNILFM